MTDIINKDIVKGVDALDMVAGSIAKPLVEKVMSPIVGNGNLISGGAKLVTAFAAAKYGGSGRVGKAVAIGAGMDGAEDIILGLGSKVGVSQANQTGAGIF